MSKVSMVVEIVGLVVTTVFLVAKIVLNALAANATLGIVKNTTGEISDKYDTLITPAGWAFTIWGVIYTWHWQCLWVLYAWTFVCRPKTLRTIFVGVYFAYPLVCILNISWIFLWGYLYITAASVILILFQFVFYPTIAMLAVYLYKVQSEAKVYDLWITRLLVLNGLLFYTTWTTIASMINLAIALQYKADVTPSTAACAVSLPLLTAAVITYFILENTVFDRFLRYSFAVYPVIIWALSAVLAANWGRKGASGANIFTLVLLILTVVLTLTRIVLFILFTFFRPIKPNCKHARLGE